MEDWEENLGEGWGLRIKEKEKTAICFTSFFLFFFFPATEQHQELEHGIATLKGEKSHVENQLKILQQKNEIMVEMYQQKENALQQ